VTAVADKAQVERELDRAWGELMKLVEATPEDACTQAGVVEDWSLKDLLGHIAFWSQRAAETLRCATAGRLSDVPIGRGANWVDEWNAKAYAERKDLPFTQVRAEWMRNHEDATKALDATPPEKLDEKLRDNPVLQYFAGDTYEHYREHAEHIKAWLQQVETTEA